jgi:hypothetical protein
VRVAAARRKDPPWREAARALRCIFLDYSPPRRRRRIRQPRSDNEAREDDDDETEQPPPARGRSKHPCRKLGSKEAGHELPVERREILMGLVPSAVMGRSRHKNRPKPNGRMEGTRPMTPAKPPRTDQRSTLPSATTEGLLRGVFPKEAGVRT